MSIIDQIRAEVERLKKEATHFIEVCKRDKRPFEYWEGQWNALELINKALDTLQEKSEKPINPVCEGLDNIAIMNEIRTLGCYPSEFDVARHFYELGRQSKREVSEDLEEQGRIMANELVQGLPIECASAIPSIKEKIVIAVRHGALWQKEQMMKEAVESEIWNYSSDTDLRAIPIWGIEKFRHLKDGDKVKLIIIKEERK